MAEARRNNRPRKSETSPEQAFVEGFFRVVAQGFRALYRLIRPAVRRSEHSAWQRGQQEIVAHWAKVEAELLQPGREGLAIQEADKLLDAALKLHDVSGDSMGERLKAAANMFNQDLYNRIWQAHKLRNALAHEMGAQASPAEAREAVTAFRQALSQLQILS